MFKVAYVLTTNGNDIFADMALLSMLSVRISNPSLSIIALCDEKSAEAVNRSEHRFLEICNEMISVQVPDGPPVFKNRWIKSQLFSNLEGDVLYLDADTLVRGSLTDLPQLVKELGGVANHNGSTLSEQVWTEDSSVSAKMGWPVDFKTYINGGMFFYRKCQAVDRFFAKWHEFLIAGISANGRLRDQPSLNSAIVASGVDLAVLSSCYNKQLIMPWKRTSEARVWHFYAAEDWNENPFSLLVGKASKLSMKSLRSMISRLITAPSPWPNQGFFARFLARRIDVRGVASVEESLWLKERRLDALRFLGGKTRAFLNNL